MAEEKEKPFTREDVLKLIEENGGTTEGLDLSGKIFEERIDLSGLDLRGIILWNVRFPMNFKREPVVGANLAGIHFEEADLMHAHLEGANLHNAHLEGAILWHAHLERATLWDTHLEGANLYGAHLEGTNLMNTKFSPDVSLEDVDWGNYILDEEKPGFFDSAVASYRHLKMWYANAGYADIAAKFYYREKEANRKALKLLSTASWYHRLALEASYLVFGHGEGWKRLLLVTMPSLVLGFAVIYYLIGTLTPNTFLNSLYYSAVSFTALGYGNWAPEPTGWVKGLGAFEAFIGVFMMALFLITFVRKMTR